MRKTLLTLALFSSGLAQAATPVDGWYSGVFGGYSYFPDNVSNTTAGLLRNQSSYQSGYNAGVRLGFQSNPIRYEAEYTYLHATTKGFMINNVSQTGVSGNISGNFIMANLYYDFPEMVASITPYLGAGIGYAYVQTYLDSTGPNNGVSRFKASDSAFAYQATAGLTYNFAENYAANIAYRYASTDRVSTFGKVVQAHLATVGVTYRFDEINYK